MTDGPGSKTQIGRYGGIPVYAEDVDAVPIEDLEALAEELRENSDECHDYWQETDDPEYEGKAAAYCWSVTRLRGVINNYE